MEVIQAHTINYDNIRNQNYHNYKRKELAFEAHFDSIHTDESVEIVQSLEASLRDTIARKQAEQNGWVNLSDYWLKVADTKDWDNVKSRLDRSKPCKMGIVRRKIEALKCFKQRAVKKAKSLGIEYKIEYVKSINRFGKECYMNRKDVFIRRKHIGLFFTERNGRYTKSPIRNRQAQIIKAFGVDNHIQNKLAIHNIRYNTFIMRLKQGWSIERASTVPPINKNTERFLEMYPHRAWEIAKPRKRRKRKCK